MTSDPERLLSVRSEADELERELLASLQRVGPPAGAKDTAWRGIAGQLAAGVAFGAAAGSSAAVAKASAGSLVPAALSAKLALVLAVTGVGAGGYWAHRSLSASDAAPAAAPAPQQARRVAPAAAPALAKPPEASVPAAQAAPAEPSAQRRASEPRQQDLLRRESELLTEARAALRGGKLAAAEQALDRLASQFPRGVLAQEREVLAIEVLAARGNAAGAERRARAFIKAYPKSPHSAKLSRFLDPP